MSDGKIEYKTEGRQILVHVQVQIDILHVNIVHVIVYISYAPMSEATCKMNFNVQFIVNIIDVILFSANVQLVDEIHWNLPCM